MKSKLLISTAMVATAFCVNAAQAENPPASMSNDRYVYPNIIGGTYTMTNAVLESGNDAEWADPVDMLIQNAKITATDSDIESTGNMTVDGSNISVTSTKITNEQLEPWIRYGEEDEKVMEELYGIYARDDIDIVDSQISLTRSYINANSELKDGNLTISDTENDDKPTSLTLTNSRIDTGAIKVEGGEINIKDSAMHGMYDITVSGGVANIDNGELTVDVGSPVDDVYTQGKLTISGGEINLKNGGSIGVEIPDESVGSQGTVEMTGGKVNVVNKGDVVTKEFDMTGGELNIAQGATFDVIKDAYLDESDKVVISEYSDIAMGDDAVINLEGNLNTSGISGTGTLNFNAKDAKVSPNIKFPVGGGDEVDYATANITGVDVNINADNTFVDLVDTDMYFINSLTIDNNANVNFEGFAAIATSNANSDNIIKIKSGTVNMKDKDYGTEFIANSINISGGTINVSGHSIIDSKEDDLQITGGTVNLSGNLSSGEWSSKSEDKKISHDGKVVVTGGELNAVSNTARIATELDVSGEGVLNVKSGSTLKIYEQEQFYDDEEYEAGTAGYETYGKGLLNLTNGGVANIEGTLIADVDGNDKGTLNFNAENAVVDGDVENVNVTFESDHTLSKAMTGSVDANMLTIKDGTVNFDNNQFKANSLNISGGTTNVNDDFYVSTLQNPNGGDITISDGTVNLNGYSLNAMSGGITVSGGIVNLKNVGEDPDNTLWAAKDINITGGVVNMEEGSSIDTFYDWLDEGGNQIDKPEQPGNIYISGGTVNVNGKSAEISSEGEIEVSDGGAINVAKGASLESYSSYSIVDGDMEEGDKATIYLRNNGTINVSGKLIADVDGNDKGTLNFNLSDAVVDGDVESPSLTFNTSHSLSNAITGTIGDLDKLTVAKGTLTFDKEPTGTITTVDVANGATLDIGSNTLHSTGDKADGEGVYFRDNSTLKYVATSADEHGQIKANYVNISNKGTTLSMAFNGAAIAEDDSITIKLFDQSEDEEGVEIEGKFANLTSNTRYRFTDEGNGFYKVSNIASAADVVEEAGGSANNAATAQAWDKMDVATIANKITTAIVNVLTELTNWATSPQTQQRLINALTALAPETAPAVQQAATEGANQIFGAVGTRLSGGSVASSRRGMSSGDNPFTNTAVWVQGLYNKAELDNTRKSKGFDSKTYGTAMGIEGKLNEEIKLGLGYAYSKTDIDGFMRDTDAKTHTAIVYGEYKPSNWYVNTVASYGWSDYDEKKDVAGVGVKANWDVESFAVQTMTGYEMSAYGYDITPELGLRYIHIEQDSYKDSADQKVSGNKSDILTGVLGTKVAKSLALDNGMLLTPEIKAAMTYDMKNDKGNSVVTLANGSTYTVSGKPLDRFGVELGAGVTTELNDNVELSLGYEGKFRKDYKDHTALINAKYKF